MKQAVTTLSIWGERRFGYSSLRESTEALVEENWSPLPGAKEDSIIEEKELEDSEVVQRESSTTNSVQEAVVENSAAFPVDVHSSIGAELCEELSIGNLPQPKSLHLPSVHTSDGDAGSNHAESEEGETSRPQTPVMCERDQQGGDTDPWSSQACSPLGDVAPEWVPDAQAPACMKCSTRFTFTKRRHHCRACGKVFCVVCCDLRFRLTHLDGKEGRVCVSCHSALLNKPVPKGQRRVWFADSPVRRRGPSSTPPGGPADRRAPAAAQEAEPGPDWGRSVVEGSLSGGSAPPVSSEGLPPILTSTGVKGDYTVEERPSEASLLEELESGRADGLVFVLNANLLARVKLINYLNRRCWCVVSKGMHGVGQAELVVLLQYLPEEKSFPSDIFSHFQQLYRDAMSGKPLVHLTHSVVTRGLLGSKDHIGFLFIRPSFQSVEDLPLPSQPYLFGVLILREEIPWAKAFPLRLMLRLGAEYRFYPCPLYSVRFRKPVFGEVSNSIMRLLVDFRFYRYTLPTVTGLMVDMEARSTCIKIPKARHSELLRALNKSNENVLAMGACFNERADSHLICMQTEDGQYQTQAISIHNQPRKVTGSCFFVFSGALRAASGYLAKSSIVEDGLMVQITMETMAELRRALREMRDFTVTCGKIDQSDRQEHVHIEWLEEEPHFNKGIFSPIDGKSMECVTSSRSYSRSEHRSQGKLIRWTEVFFLQRDNHGNHSRLTERLARAFCQALCPHLKLLKEDGVAKLALRVTLDSQKVDYQAGSNGQFLPAQYLTSVDKVLSPILQNGSLHSDQAGLQMELIFHILEDIS